MRLKKFLAVTTATTMVLGSTVSAIAGTTGDAIDDFTDTTIGGTGDIDAISTVKYDVTLPTDGALNFKVDPQGLANIENGSSASLSDISDNAGKITADGVAYAYNQSSKDIKVSVALTATATGVTLAADQDTYDAKDDADVTALLLAVPSSDDVTSISSTADDFSAAADGIVLSDTAVTLEFILEKADYVITKDDTGAATFELKKDENDSTDSNAHGFGLQIVGHANPTADWTTNSPSLAVSAVYSLEDVAADVTSADGFAYGLQSGSYTTAEAPTDEIRDITATKVAGEALVVKTYAPVVSAKLVKYNNAANTNSLTLGNQYTVNGKTMTINSTWMGNVTGQTIMTLTFADGQTQTLTILVD